LRGRDPARGSGGGQGSKPATATACEGRCFELNRQRPDAQSGRGQCPQS